MKSVRLVLCSLLFSSLAQAAPQAILTGVKGAVQIVQGGKTVPGKNGTTLEAGDTVQVGAGGAATVYYANRPPQTLGANQQVQVAAPGATTKPSLWSNIYKGVAAGFARRGEKVGATVRGPNDPPFASKEIIPLSPVNSRLLKRPVLTWVLRETPGDFQVTVTDANAKVLWQAQSTQSSLAIPPEILFQEGKKYFWRVVPRFLDNAGKLTPDEEKSSLDSWFELAPAAEIATVQQEQTEIAEALKNEEENTRRVALAAALAERSFYDEAIALLTHRTLEMGVSKGDVRVAVAGFDALLANMEEAARWQLRKLYADSGQIELATRIAPDITAAPAGEQGVAGNEPAAANAVNTNDYADPDGTFALRVPQGWSIKRDPVAEGLWLTIFSSGDAKAPQITVLTQALTTPQTLETFGELWLGQVVNFLGQNGTVKAETAKKARFLGHDVVRMALDYDSPDTGPQRGFLNVILGQKTALMVGYAAAVDKPLELGRLEAILNTFAAESKKSLATTLPEVKQ